MPNATRVLVVCCAAALPFGGLAPRPAAAIEFNPTNAVELQAALDAAEASVTDDVVHLLPITYSTADIGQDFRYISFQGGKLVIDGAGPATSRLDGNGLRKVLTINSTDDVEVTDLGIVNGAKTAISGQLKGAATEMLVQDVNCPPRSLLVRNVTISDSQAHANGTTLLGGIANIDVPCGQLVIEDVTFSGNTGTQTGVGSVLGGILRTGNGTTFLSTTTITNLTFSGNSTTSDDGAVYGGIADLNARTLTVDGLSAFSPQVTATNMGSGDSYGGILSGWSGAGGLSVDRVTISNATVSFAGDTAGATVHGGVAFFLIDGQLDATLDRLTLQGNVFTDGGAGTINGGILAAVYNQNPDPARSTTLSRSRILSNRATSALQSIGMIHLQPFGDRITRVVNNAIGLNTTTVTGDADNLGTLLAGGDPLQLLHNTIWNNRLVNTFGNSSGGGLFVGNGGSAVDLSSNIIWGNQADLGADVRLFGTTFSVNLQNNDIGDLSIQGGTVLTNTGNVSIDPHLAAGGNDFHLTAQSIGILDAGDTTPPLPMPATDIEGDPRVIPPGPDMGADEATAAALIAVEVPTLTEWGLVALAAALAGLAAGRLKRNRNECERRQALQKMGTGKN